MLCAIWYYLFKKRENTHGGVLLLVTLQASACNFTKTNTPSWMIFTFFKLCKWYKIAQRTTNVNSIIPVHKKTCCKLKVKPSDYYTKCWTDNVQSWYKKIGVTFIAAILMSFTAWKVSVFGVFLVRIQSECGKIQTRKIPNMDTFHPVLIPPLTAFAYLSAN